MQSIFLVIFTLFWSGFVLAFDGFMAHSTFKQFETRNFPAVTGTVTHSEVKSHRGSKGRRSYEAVIEYRFKVNGQTYYGNRLRYSAVMSSSASANSIVAAHPDGSAVPVYYDPDNPQDSLLFPGISGADLIMALFLTPFNMVMFGLWIWVGGRLRERFFRPAAGGVKIITDGLNTRVRLPQFAAVLWGLLTTGGLGFVSIFALGFSTQMQPSLWLALSVIGAVYLAGAGVWLWQQRKIDSGIDDLVINESARSLDLPQTFGRKQAVTVSLADIERLSVEQIVHRSSKGGISYTYAPTLSLRGPAAGTQKLADWSDKLKADDFTEWLRKQLGV